MEKTASVLVYKDANGKVWPAGCSRFVSCGAKEVHREWISTIEQAGISGCGRYSRGQVVPPNFPNSVHVVKIIVDDIGPLWVDAASFDANFATQCSACCTPAPCVLPSALSISNITTTGGLLNFTPASGATGYQYVVKTTNVAPTASGTYAAGSPVTLSGLTTGTTYYVFVSTICPGGVSAWVMVSFTTS